MEFVGYLSIEMGIRAPKFYDMGPNYSSIGKADLREWEIFVINCEYKVDKCEK